MRRLLGAQVSVAEWKAAYDQQVRPSMSWLPEADFEITPNGENRAYYRDLIAGRSKFYVPDHAPELDLLRHEAGHAAHAAAAVERDLLEGHGTAGTDIYREVAAIVSPGVVWPTSGPDLRDEWTAEAFRKAIGGDLAIVRYPDPPGVLSPYPVAALRTYFATMNVPRIPPTPPQKDPVVEWVGAAAAGNFMAGRSGKSIALIVDHWTTSSMASAIQHFKTAGTQVSAHYIVGMAGRIVQVVADEDTAHHAGQFPVNQISIGIEHEAGPVLPPTPELYAASAWLHRMLADKYGIALEVGVTVKRHNNIVATECPGTLDLDRIVREAEDMAYTDEDRAQMKRIEDKLNAFTDNLPKIWLRRLFWGFDPFTRLKREPTTQIPTDIP